MSKNRYFGDLNPLLELPTGKAGIVNMQGK